MSFPRLLRISCLGLAAFLLSGCADEAPSLKEARRFDAYPVYYAGMEVGGFPLVYATGEDGQIDPRPSAWFFVYGHCVDPPDEGGCAPPVQIHNYSACERWAGVSTYGHRLYDFRGAKARWGGVDIGGSMEIFTSRTTVTIGGDPNVVKAAVRALRLVDHGQPTASLLPPVPGSLAGKLPCQRKPG